VQGARSAGFLGSDEGPKQVSGTLSVVYPIPPWSTRCQFSKSPSSPPECVGGERAGQSLGASVGRPMAERIFLMVSSVLMRAISRSGVLQRGHVVSIANVLLSSSLQEI
jgi:hypothetical protein